ncbi:solute carrier family 22 member 4-like [Saccostrea cucullata]|uniref:solute carrier family 22 member 4-like n=1 Tax=Saccostrea cuccullata TaxID=36930 RepID=UPI002ED30FD7
MDAISDLLEDIVKECGGFGKFQWILILILFGTKITVTWSMLMMTFGGATPDWWCNVSKMKSSYNLTSWTNSSASELFKKCHPPANMTGSCDSMSFSSEMNTVVSEFELVCDNDWITSFTTTIQMAGLLISSPIAGQMADSIGRKPTFFLSLLALTVFNLGAGFSVCWEMFTVFRFLIGFGCGMYLTTFYSFITEFVPMRWRSMISAIPAWATFAAFYGLFSWWLHDWAYLHFATAIVTAPFLLGIFIIPESFRWSLANNKFMEAENAIKRIASINSRETPKACIKRLYDITEEEKGQNKHKNHTVIDILKNRRLLKNSFLLWTSWVACGYAYYAISFGVEQLSGSLYLNMFLLSVVEIPATLITWFLNNCIGRRWTCFLFFMIAAVGGASVGTVQIIDPPQAGEIINIAALISKMGVSAGWAALIIFTTESYPTVVRNIGYGMANSSARIGAMIAPQIVHISKHIPGVMYYICGGCMLISAVFCVLLPETKGKALENVIPQKTKKTEHKKQNEDITILAYELKQKEKY